LTLRVSVNTISLQSYTLESNATDAKLSLYTARDVLLGECQELHTSRAFIYTKQIEDALQTAIHEAPLPMRLHRQHPSIPFHPNCSPSDIVCDYTLTLKVVRTVQGGIQGRWGSQRRLQGWVPLSGFSHFVRRHRHCLGQTQVHVWMVA